MFGSLWCDGRSNSVLTTRVPKLGFRLGKKSRTNGSMCTHEHIKKSNIQQCVLTGVRFPGSALNDGQWHSVELNSRRGRLSITVDKEEGGGAHASPTFPVAIQSQLFFGGKSEIDKLQFSKKLDPIKCQTALWEQMNKYSNILITSQVVNSA